MWSRRAVCLEVLNGLHLPLDLPAPEVAKAVFDAYPFGERKYHPYKVWLAVVREWQAERTKLARHQAGSLTR